MADDQDACPQENILREPLELSLCALLVAIVIVAFMQVVFRYVIKMSLDWSEELARFLFMWLAGLGAAYAFKSRSHFALTFVVDRFPERARRLIGHVVVLIVSVFLAVFTYQAVKYTWSVRNQIAPA